MLESLNAIAKENGWDDWSDVVFNAENRRTILSISEKAEIHLQEHIN